MNRAGRGARASGGGRPGAAGQGPPVGVHPLPRLRHADLTEPAHRVPVQLQLVDRLVGAGPPQFRGTVGGDHEQSAGSLRIGGLYLLNCLDDARQAAIDRLDSRDGRLPDTAVADHVGVGVVRDDEVIPTRLDRLDQRVRDPWRAHLGLQVVGGHLRRRDQRAVLIWKIHLATAVEEIGHVGVFLGFGDPQLA